jgi:Fe-S-cluster containining protein
MRELEGSDPVRAARVRDRARDSVARLAPKFPGNPNTGILAEDEEAEARFADFADDEPCPALDPATGMCDLYSARPMTCRTFGPPVRSGEEGALGVCELCYQGARDEEIAACEMMPDPDNLEEPLIKQMEESTGMRGNTIVAFCLR